VQLPHGAEHDARLAERGQDLPDVGQEGGVGPHDEHAAPRQPVAVGVEQVRGAVQGHRGLAGAGPALHHQHARRLRPDDRVLLGLDRGDDVAHPAGAPRVDGGEQGGLAGQPAGLGDRGGVVEVQHLVVDGGDLAAAGAQVAPAPDALRRCGGGRVERPGRGRPPVHQQRLVLVVLVEQPQPPDVAALAVLHVEPAEGEPVLRGPQRGEPVGVHGGSGVALGEGLRRADGLVVQHAGEPAGRLGPAGVETLVQHADVGPLVLDPVLELVRDAGVRHRGGRAVRHRQITFAGMAERQGDL
jgi:hypothetical protein